jgi:hypothetical protein
MQPELRELLLSENDYINEHVCRKKIYQKWAEPFGIGQCVTGIGSQYPSYATLDVAKLKALIQLPLNEENFPGLYASDTRRMSKIRAVYDAIIIDVLTRYFSQNRWFDDSETILDMNEILLDPRADEQTLELIFQMAVERQSDLDIDHNPQEQDFYKLLLESKPYYEINHPHTSVTTLDIVRATQSSMKQEIQEITDKKEDNQSKKTDGFTPK